MSLEVRITDARGNPHKACVTQYGQIVVGPASYDQTKYVELAEDDTAYNFYVPQANKRFVISGLRAKADRQVSSTVDAEVIIYEASAPDTLTADKVLHQEALVRGESVTIIPMNLIVEEGKWVNAKTSDDDIHMTIFGYYVDIMES